MSGEQDRFRWVAELTAKLVAHPWISLLVILAVTAGAIFYAKEIEIRSDMEDLFPENTPNVQRAREARETVGNRSQMQILIGGPEREQNRALAEALAGELGKLDLVSDVEFRRDISFFEKNALLFLSVEDVQDLHDKVHERIKEAIADDLNDGFDLEDEDEASDAPKGEEDEEFPTVEELKKKHRVQDIREYFESPDGQVVAVKVYPSFKPADTTKTKALNDSVDGILAKLVPKDSGITVTTEGDYSQVTQAVKQISNDLTLATGVALGGIALILIVYFRRLRAVILVLVPLVIALAMTAFFGRLTIGYLNLITAMIFAILVGLGIDFVVHAASRADEEFRSGKPLDRALPDALKGLGRAMLAAALTTMSTFAALSVFEFRGFSQFGILAAMGVALALITVYLVLAPLSAAMDRVWKRRAPRVAPAEPASQVEPASGEAAESAERPQARPPNKRLGWTLLAVFAGLAAFAGTQMPDLVFEADMRKMRSKSTKKSSALKAKYRKEAESRTSSPALVITGGLEETEKVHRYWADRLDTTDSINDVLSIYTFVPAQQMEKLAIVQKIKRRVDQKYGALEDEDKERADELRAYLDPEPFEVEQLPEWVKARFTDTYGNLGRYVLLYATGVKSEATNVLKIYSEIGETTLDGKTYYATASWMILGDAYTTVKKEGPLAVGLACLVILLFLTLDFRRARDVVLVFLPLATGFVLFLGCLSVAGIPLNLFNIVVLPTIFGIGVDTSIHLVHRLHEGTPLRKVLTTTGAAAGVSSATTAVGFASLLFVSNQGLQSIGWVAVIGIGCCYLSCIALTAALVSVGFFKPKPS